MSPAFQATFDALNKIVDSGGTEGAGILPLGEVVGSNSGSCWPEIGADC